MIADVKPIKGFFPATSDLRPSHVQHAGIDAPTM
jgi:hypothetical protein